MNSLRAKPRLCFSALLLLGAGVCVAVPVVADEPSLPKPVRIGEDATAEKSDVRPVTIGEGTATQKSDVAPVKVGGTAKDNSPVGIEPVTLGAGAKTTKPDLSALKVGGVAALGGVNIAAVTASSLRVPLLLGQVSSGAATVESLLQSGALKPADLLWAAHHPGLWMEKAPVQQATPGTIEVYDAFLARFDEQVVGAVEWERPARAALAAELSRRGDARCVPLFEAMTADWVEEWKRDGGRKIDGTVPGLHALAWYYQAKDEKLKAARTYEMSEQYSVAPAWVGSALVEAARLYRDVNAPVRISARF